MSGRMRSLASAARDAAEALVLPHLRGAAVGARGRARMWFDPALLRVRVMLPTGTAKSVAWTTDVGAGTGDVVGPSSSVASEVALFDGTTGKILKRATGSGLAKLTSGVLSAVSAWTSLGITGTASRLAGFDGSGNAAEYTIARNALLWGHGGDGNLTFDGSAAVTIAGVSHSPSSGVYTLTRPINAKNIAMSGGAVIKPAGWPIRAWSMTGTGTIRDNGNNGSGTTGGSALSTSGSMQRASGAGSSGRSTSGGGFNGSPITMAMGGQGASGGAGGGGGGGNGGGVTTPDRGTDGWMTEDVSTWGPWRGLSGSGFKGGSGGGGGGFAVGGTGTSGAGGGGGGVIAAAIRDVQGTLTVEAKGGTGSDASMSVGAGGGGGGGGGGCVVMLYESGSPTVTVTGGAGGAGSGGGASGSTGADGRSASLQIAL